jgi:amicoumacin kinase
MMEKAVEAVYSQGIINKFLEVFQLEQSYKLLGDFENYVYEVIKEDTPYILRVTHSSHRTIEEIYGEMNWIHYLTSRGANVPDVYQSINNHLVEKQVAKDNTVFYACLFSKVTGQPIPINDEAFNETLFESWGKEIGNMHRISVDYLPNQFTRKQWFEDDLFEIEKYVPDEPIVIDRTKEIIETLHKLPQKNYGLIHNDVHYGNFFYNGQDIHIFDFDDSCYFWHVSDIAIPLYYSCYGLFTDTTTQEEKEDFANTFTTAFMKGYSQEMEPPEKWEELIPLFLKVRDITLYAALNKKIAPADRNERLQKRMEQLKKRIEDKEAIVTLSR